MRPLLLILALLCWLQPPPLLAESRIDVGQFSAGDLSGWQHKKFHGETRYRLLSEVGRSVLRADAHQSASMLYFPVKVDLQKTPVLNWSWRKITALDPGDESQKSGDDYVARVYVIKRSGWFSWNTRAINYVWSFQHQRGQVWDNPFGGSNAKMLSQRDASHGEGSWFSERRNVSQDFRDLFGQQVRYIDGIAIMSDSDNSGSTASASYGDIYFSAR